ncbi:MAG: Purine nucleoside phosphoramidase [Candidatus Moanabacter tarae]|uniref:Purine nucleoside phosphoramidase n=1 Tax=Candidatus Moanibacter tarae TaxID=2200854 RepID=A0A2Z4ABH9_9BACT|nr:MAG: Purine nucleoside phosphoramidase [Candidatus Moanabacter tarae]|tara:strand:- start:189 stop:530 length:342 start_codon:yes stop_codon:yes gene_type:complete
MEKPIFQKIIDRDIPAKIEYEDDLCIAIHDLNPQAPTHILVIPKKVIQRIGDADDDDREILGHLLLTATNISKKNKLSSGFRIVINNGPHGGESVPHMHVHLLGGRQMAWPPG